MITEVESLRLKRCRNGEGPNGLVGRFLLILQRLRGKAKVKGYKSPNITSNEMLIIWESQKGLCPVCGGPINLLGLNGSTFDHNHETGEARGFIHDRCNRIEGQLLKMSDDEFEKYLNWVRSVRVS